jgi:ubiquinone/menaquinone biosynthesis C-methylase UbiE
LSIDLKHTKQAFDRIASNYDSRNNQNEILQWMRSIVHNVYTNELKNGYNVLELNAGTGIDAIFLARNGIKVYATDISPEMIARLKEKTERENIENILDAKVISFDEIDQVEEAGFDAAISNFGGLNCINNFEKLAFDLSEKLNTGGKFIAVVMNKFCPWEIFYYLLKLDFKNAFRRFKKEGFYADLNGEKVLTYYYSPEKLGKFFKNNFKIKKIYTLGLFTPPPYLIGIYRRFKTLVKLWMGIDKFIKGLFPFNRFGDHFIIVMNKK